MAKREREHSKAGVREPLIGDRRADGGRFIDFRVGDAESRGACRNGYGPVAVNDSERSNRGEAAEGERRESPMRECGTASTGSSLRCACALRRRSQGVIVFIHPRHLPNARSAIGILLRVGRLDNLDPALDAVDTNGLY